MKRKLLFAELEKEINLVPLEDLNTFKGGYVTTTPTPADCFFQSLNSYLSELGLHRQVPAHYKKHMI